MPTLTYKLDLAASAVDADNAAAVVHLGTHALSPAANAAVFAAATLGSGELWFSEDAAGTDYADVRMDIAQWSDSETFFLVAVRMAVTASAGGTIYLQVGDKPGDYPTGAPDPASTILRADTGSIGALTTGPTLSMIAGSLATELDAVHGLVYDFDGSNVVGTSTAFPNLPDSSGQTFDFWLKTSTSNDYVVGSREGGDGGMAVFLPSGAVRITLDSATGAEGSTAVNDNAWHHVAVTYDGGGSGSYNAKVWVDGASDGTGTSATFAWVQNKLFGIGGRGDSSASLVGQLTKVCAHNTVLPDATIALNARLGGSSASSYWTATVPSSGLPQRHHYAVPGLGLGVIK